MSQLPALIDTTNRHDPLYLLKCGLGAFLAMDAKEIARLGLASDAARLSFALSAHAQDAIRHSGRAS